MYTTLIDVTTLATQIASAKQAANTVILDCRFSLADTELGEKAWQKQHIPGAHYLHLDRDLSSPIVAGKTGRHPLPEREQLAATLRRLGISQDTQVIVADAGNGAIAARCWWLLRWLGHEAVAVLDGGYAAWEAAGQAQTDEVSKVAAEGTLTPQAPLEDVIDITTVEQGQHTLIDAREAERYRGDIEPIDPVAGHIPGALNLPFAENIGSDGTFRPAHELRARFNDSAIATLLASEERRPLAHYCGSGVTAAHNVLAMRHAGLEPGTLYAGSFSEWVSRDDKSRSVARQDDA